MTFETLNSELLDDYTRAINVLPLDKLSKIKKNEIPVDYFQFYKSVSSVYSSKIEGEDIDFDSYFKHKFLKVEFKPDYTRRADDLYAAYDFIDTHSLNLENLKQAHALITTNILPVSYQGVTRQNPMYVLNSNDQIEYVAAEPRLVNDELEKLFRDIEKLLKLGLNQYEIFYYASLIHLVFVKIHPFQDGNGRTARLLEKWFLLEKIGLEATTIQLEKNYYIKLNNYYSNIKALGLEYGELDYKKSLDFLLMTVKWIEEQE
ncbi:Fic family protein [Pedobacter glucosidilyticus]|uniref:Fic family protein n=1 Tax=Pedobacter glucosidilyticus TaxID=1122941 RepID=UPI000425CF32|nr:Fic family protein [Pedobacter glucosidilyticus]